MQSVLNTFNLLLRGIKDRILKKEVREARDQVVEELKQKDREIKRLKKEDLLRRKESQRSLRKLMSLRGYWNKKSDLRHYQQNLEVESKTVPFNHYLIKNNFNAKSIEYFLKVIRDKVLELLHIQKKVLYTLKITLYKFNQLGNKIRKDHYLPKPFYVIIDESDKEKSFDSLTEFYNSMISELKTRESG